MARRHQVSQIIAGAQQVRPEISYRAEERKSLAGTGRGLVIKPDGPLTGGEVSEDGVIILRGSVDGYPVQVGLKPYLRDGKVQWRCRSLKVVEGWFIPASGYFSQSCPKASALDPL